jgi:hypothetical protein
LKSDVAGPVKANTFTRPCSRWFGLSAASANALARPAVNRNEKEKIDMPNYSLVAAALITACICNAAALAQENLGTPEQRAACTPDALRLCSSFIPDPDKVESCLRQRKPDLSDACKSVFERRATGTSNRSK